MCRRGRARRVARAEAASPPLGEDARESTTARRTSERDNRDSRVALAPCAAASEPGPGAAESHDGALRGHGTPASRPSRRGDAHSSFHELQLTVTGQELEGQAGCLLPSRQSRVVPRTISVQALATRRAVRPARSQQGQARRRSLCCPRELEPGLDPEAQVRRFRAVAI